MLDRKEFEARHDGFPGEEREGGERGRGGERNGGGEGGHLKVVSQPLTKLVCSARLLEVLLR